MTGPSIEGISNSDYFVFRFEFGLDNVLNMILDNENLLKYDKTYFQDFYKAVKYKGKSDRIIIGSNKISYNNDTQTVKFSIFYRDRDYNCDARFSFNRKECKNEIKKLYKHTKRMSNK